MKHTVVLVSDGGTVTAEYAHFSPEKWFSESADASVCMVHIARRLTDEALKADGR